MTKYASALYVPSIIALVGWTGLKQHGAVRGIFSVFVVGVLFTMGLIVLLFGFPGVMAGLLYTTVGREAFTPWSRFDLAKLFVEQTWIISIFAVAGFFVVCRRKPILALLLLGTFFLAPLYHIRSTEWVSMNKHIGFGMPYAAPLAAFGILWLSRYVEDVVRPSWITTLVIAMLMFAFGLNYSQQMFWWNNSTTLMHTLRAIARPHESVILTDEIEVLQYDTNGFLDDSQLVNMYTWGFVRSDGSWVDGADAYIEGTRDGLFDIITIGYNAGVRQADALAGMEPYLSSPDCYELVQTLPNWGQSGLNIYRRVMQRVSACQLAADTVMSASG